MLFIKIRLALQNTGHSPLGNRHDQGSDNCRKYLSHNSNPVASLTSPWINPTLRNPPPPPPPVSAPRPPPPLEFPLIPNITRSALGTAPKPAYWTASSRAEVAASRPRRLPGRLLACSTACSRTRTPSWTLAWLLNCPRRLPGRRPACWTACFRTETTARKPARKPSGSLPRQLCETLPPCLFD